MLSYLFLISFTFCFPSQTLLLTYQFFSGYLCLGNHSFLICCIYSVYMCLSSTPSDRNPKCVSVYMSLYVFVCECLCLCVLISYTYIDIYICTLHTLCLSVYMSLCVRLCEYMCLCFDIIYKIHIYVCTLYACLY